jgi:hypothetical protein
MRGEQHNLDLMELDIRMLITMELVVSIVQLSYTASIMVNMTKHVFNYLSRASRWR